MLCFKKSVWGHVLIKELMKALACCLRKIHTIHLYPVLNNIALMLTMAFRLGTPCLWKRLELVRISSDGTLSDWTHTHQGQATTNLEQPKMHVRRDNSSYQLLSTLWATHCTVCFVYFLSFPRTTQ